MSRIIHHWRATLLAALAWAVSGPGCAGHRVPAIDPSGERIFSGASTAIVSPFAECPLFHPSPPRGTVPAAPACAPVQPVVPVLPAMPVATCPQPLAVVAQPIPQPATPVCNTPQRAPAPAAAPCATAPSGPLLTVTPKEIVAPVCSEVIVAAGLCDSRGYFLTGQPLEWMIPAGSIGEIVQVGKETHTGFTSYFRGSPHKVGINYVRAYTSSIAQTIDRGTPSPLDDVSLGKGQSWISVTSPTEGTTHVTVWAPKEKDWERRRTTARIHWVDAKWTFPPPQIARFGQPARLTTRIMRSNGAPVAGWIVRYDVADGPEASFGARGEKSIQLQTAADGTATVELAPNTTTPGITQVRVQIVRPSTGRDGLADMVVGQGLTSVTWSAPGLQVRASGPESVPIDGTASYRVEVINSGDMVARGVTLSFVPPRSVTVLSSSPQASPLGQTLAWRLGDMRPHTTTVVQINCRPTMVADIRAVFRAESAERLVSEAAVSTRVFASALSVRMTGPETVEVGQTAQFQIELTNTSRTAMTNLRVRDTYDPGLTEVNGKRSPLEFPIDQLQPGETKQFAVTFTVNEPGKHCHRLDVTADGGHAASARGCVTGAARAAPTTPPMSPAARLSLTIKPVTQIEVGKRGIVQFDLVNTGTAPITNVELWIEHAASLGPTQASPDAEQGDTSVMWAIASIGPRQTASRQIEFEGLQADPQAMIRALVVSDQTAEQSKETTIRVAAPAISPPMGGKAGPMGSKAGPAPPPTTNANNLKIGAADSPDPVKTGAEVTYRIEVTNAGTQADSDVVLSFTLPAGFAIKTFSEATGTLRMQSVGPFGSARYELTPIAALQVGEKIGPLTLKATAGGAGKGTLKITTTSRLNPRGMETTVETTVLP
ncbi:MAG TPA: hypothetical protein VMP01_25340 [Pirellulaceae bacterium]|nr:hypothetical protein [Pirellulaceae bacterium]